MPQRIFDTSPQALRNYQALAIAVIEAAGGLDKPEEAKTNIRELKSKTHGDLFVSLNWAEIVFSKLGEFSSTPSSALNRNPVSALHSKTKDLDLLYLLSLGALTDSLKLGNEGIEGKLSPIIARIQDAFKDSIKTDGLRSYALKADREFARLMGTSQKIS